MKRLKELVGISVVIASGCFAMVSGFYLVLTASLQTFPSEPTILIGVFVVYDIAYATALGGCLVIACVSHLFRHNRMRADGDKPF